MNGNKVSPYGELVNAAGEMIAVSLTFSCYYLPLQRFCPQGKYFPLPTFPILLAFTGFSPSGQVFSSSRLLYFTCPYSVFALRASNFPLQTFLFYLPLRHFCPQGKYFPLSCRLQPSRKYWILPYLLFGQKVILSPYISGNPIRTYRPIFPRIA